MDDTPQTGDRAQILVVEDESTDQLIINRVLSQDGHDAQICGTIAEAMAQLETTRFDLLIVDKNLKDGSGLELAKEVSKRNRDAEIIIISAYATLDSAIEAVRLSVGDFITKPFHVKDFSARVRRVLEHQSLRRHNRQLIDQLQKKNELLESLAVRDPLTGLFNHVHLKETVDQEIYRAKRNNNELSLIFIDLDKFKAINDTLGHPVGDKILKEFSQIITGDGGQPSFSLRADDIVGRYGGDEFVILLPNTDKAGATLKAEALRSVVEARALGITDAATITASIGVASYPEDGETRSALLNAADTAMYIAKEAGGNAIVSHVAEMQGKRQQSIEHAETAIERLKALKKTIQEKAFTYALQPIVDCQQDSVIGYEIFCRPSDDHFSNAAALFTTAERAGRIVELGRVIRLEFAKAVNEAPKNSYLFINIHPFELYDNELLTENPQLKQYAPRIVFEVTDTSAIRNVKRAKQSVQQLREMGFRIALDELGPEYGSLNKLLQIEPDFVKFNISLLEDVTPSSRAGRLVTHFFDCARSERISVIIAGVETEQQRKTAMSFGGRFLQGYLFARPCSQFKPVTPSLVVPAEPSE